MSALFALFFFIAPARAGVIAPVESAVAPAGPSMSAVPALVPAAGSLIAPSYGGADLRGGIPLLPSPVPGLIGMPAMNFVGNAPESAVSHPEAAAPTAAPAPASPLPGRAAQVTPTLPGQPSPGSSALAISRDRRSAGAAPENGASTSGALARGTATKPLVDTSLIEKARPEDAAGLGQRFFDQSSDKNQGALASPSAGAGKAAPSASAVGTQGQTGTVADGGVPASAGGGHARRNDLHAYSPEGETLRDAVASVLPPGAGAGAPLSGASAQSFRSAAPNGVLTPGPAEVLPVAGALAAPGAPSPLALDLSRSGLIVRVRSAVNEALSFAPAAAPLPAPVTPGPSTALLERGAMLEAFSVSRAYAEAAPLAARETVSRVSRAASSSVPFAPENSPIAVTLSLWWAWLVLPFAALAFRGL